MLTNLLEQVVDEILSTSVIDPKALSYCKPLYFRPRLIFVLGSKVRKLKGRNINFCVYFLIKLSYWGRKYEN